MKSDAYQQGHARTGTMPHGAMAAPQTIELYERMERTEVAPTVS